MFQMSSRRTHILSCIPRALIVFLRAEGCEFLNCQFLFYTYRGIPEEFKEFSAKKRKAQGVKGNSGSELRQMMKDLPQHQEMMAKVRFPSAVDQEF